MVRPALVPAVAAAVVVVVVVVTHVVVGSHEGVSTEIELSQLRLARQTGGQALGRADVVRFFSLSVGVDR